MAAQGHILDASTIGLWRMDTDFADPRRTAPTDSANRAWSYPDGGANTVSYSGTGLSGTKGQFCHSIINNATSGCLQLALQSGDQARCYGSWTIEAFVRINATGLVHSVLSCGGTADDSSINTNVIASLRINTAQRLECFWEYAGSANMVVFTLTSALTAGTWYHVAASKDATAKEVSFYVDGVLVGGAAVAYANEATGGSAAQWTIGKDAVGTPGNRSSIDVRYVTFSTTTRNGAWMTASAALKSTTGVLPTDGSTYFAIDFNRRCATDDSGEENHLVSQANTSAGVQNALYADASDAGGGIIEDGGRSRYMNQASLVSYVHDTTVLDALLADMTFECWIRKTRGAAYGSGTQAGLFCHGEPSDETAALNYFSIYITANGAVAWDIESGTGANLTAGSTANNVIVMGKRHHVAFRKKMFSTTCQLTVFVDGVQVYQTDTSQVNYTGGTGSTAYLALFRGNFGPQLTSADRFTGYVDDARLSNVARTDAEILQSYLRGIGDGGLELSIVSPPGGTTIDPGDTITLEASSPGLLTSIDDITITFFDNTTLVIYDGADFATGYEDSEISDDGNGTFTLELRPNAGEEWPDGIASIEVTGTDATATTDSQTVGSWPFVQVGAPIISNIEPAESVEAGTPGAFSATFKNARLTPITFHLSEIGGREITISVKFERYNETFTLRDAEGTFVWPFDVQADNTFVETVPDEEADVSILPRGGWPPGTVEIKVAAAIMAVEA